MIEDRVRRTEEFRNHDCMVCIVCDIRLGYGGVGCKIFREMLLMFVECGLYLEQVGYWMPNNYSRMCKEPIKYGLGIHWSPLPKKWSDFTRRDGFPGVLRCNHRISLGAGTVYNYHANQFCGLRIANYKLFRP